jgi:hypothetical protein
MRVRVHAAGVRWACPRTVVAHLTPLEEVARGSQGQKLRVPTHQVLNLLDVLRMHRGIGRAGDHMAITNQT